LLVSAAFLLVGGSGPTALAGEDMERLKLATAILVVLGTAVLSLLVFGGRFIDRFVGWAGTLRWVGGPVQKIGLPLRMFHDHPVAFGLSIVMSVGVHLMLTLSLYLIARSLYPSVPTLGEHFIIVPIGMLASALPLTPAGIGIFEATVDLLYKMIPATATNASGTLVALVFEMVKVLIAIVGTVFYWTAGEEVRESLEEAEQVEQDKAE
jgi:uncharacterized membrane protein YbhN (UPF0104 family)